MTTHFFYSAMTAVRVACSSIALAALLLCLSGVRMVAQTPPTSQNASNASNLAPWQLQNPQPQSQMPPFPNLSSRQTVDGGVDFWSVFFTSDVTGWACGRQGNILKTTDGGRTWTPKKTPTGRTIDNIQFVGERLGWAASYDGILATSDGGETWTIQAGTTDFFAETLFFIDERTGWAVGGSGQIRATTNGGETWTTQPTTLVNSMRGVQFLNATTGWAWSGDALLHTTNGGSTWNIQARTRFNATAPFSTKSFNDVCFLNATTGNATTGNASTGNASTGWLVGDENLLARTSDGGLTWTLQTLPGLGSSFDALVSVQFIDASTGWIVSDEDEIFRTDNGGTTWQKIYQFPLPSVKKIQWRDKLNGWAAVGLPNATTIWQTEDGGRTWTQRYANTINDYYALAASPSLNALPLNSPPLNSPSPSRALALGYGRMSRTDNGGRFWEMLPMPRYTDNNGNLRTAVLGAVSFVTPDVGWAVGPAFPQQQAFSTRDGGRSWTYLPTGLTPFDNLFAVSFVSEQVGWAVGGVDSRAAAPVIFSTTNGGTRWTRQTAPAGTADTLFAVQFVNATTGWATGGRGTLLATTNGGTTWTRQTSFTARDLHGVFFLNANLGWVCGGSDESSVIRKTRNGGATWERTPAPAESTLRSIYFANETTGWACGDGGIILATRDGGETWTQQESGTDVNLHSISFANGTTGWIAGEEGVLLRTTNGGYTPSVSVQSFQTGSAGSATQILNFGVIAAGQTASLAVRIEAKDLLEPLTVSVPANFSIVGGGRSITLQPDAFAAISTTLTVSFAPDRSERFAGALVLTSARINGTSATLNAAALLGFGLNRATIIANPSLLNFGVVKIGTTVTRDSLVKNSLVKNVWLKNLGMTTGTLRLNLNQANQPNQATQPPSPFAITQLLLASTGAVSTNAAVPIPLRPNDSVEVQMRFQPDSVGLERAELQIRVTGNFSDSLVSVPLLGIGGRANVSFQPTRLNLGGVSVLGSTTAVLGLVNTGNFPARITTTPTFRNGAATGFSVIAGTPDNVLDSGESNQLRIRFAPPINSSTIGFVRDTLFAITDDNIVAGCVVTASVEPLLPVPVLESPLNERIGILTEPLLIWSAVRDATSYDVQIARDTTFTQLVAEENSRSRLFLLPRPLEYSTAYFWRVRSRSTTNAAGGAVTSESPWSAPFAFRTIVARPLVRVTIDTAFTGIVGQPERLSFTLANATRDSLVFGEPYFVRNPARDGFFGNASDSAAFVVKSGQFSQRLRGSGSLQVVFDFNAAAARDYQAVMLIPVASARQPSLVSVAEVQFLGTGIPFDASFAITKLLVRANRKEVNAGDTVKLQIILSESQNLGTPLNKARTTTFDATLRVRNPSVLSVLGDTPSLPSRLSSDNMEFKGNTITLTNIPRDVEQLQNTVLAEIPMIALQGTDTTTIVEFLNFDWKGVAGGQTQKIIRTVADNPVSITVCRPGGVARLFAVAPLTQLVQLSPNPGGDVVTLDYAVGSRGVAEMFVTDVLGRRVKTLASGSHELGEYTMTFSVADLAEGSYTIVLQTPFALVQRQLKVVK